jgi:hypothetical protein
VCAESKVVDQTRQVAHSSRSGAVPSRHTWLRLTNAVIDQHDFAWLILAARGSSSTRHKSLLYRRGESLGF